jgi:glycosyltransferase involved in cell wall biosynthesis
LKKILFLCPYPYQLAPSQRFRYEQYLNQLRGTDYTFDIKTFLTPSEYSTIYQSGNSITKIATISYCYLRRFTILLHINQFDYVFIHREITPVGPPIIEWLIAKIYRKKIIYDFDDSIWLTDKVNESYTENIFRWRCKVSYICKWSYKISCGNHYLAGYAKKFNRNVIVNPTTIDTDNIHIADLFQSKTDQAVTIGWTGSHSTLKYLEKIQSVLKQIESKYPFTIFLVIADRPPKLDLKNLVFKKWSQGTEIIDLKMADIGIMPLPDDEWAKGKCGFKALQYMALGIPAVVSPVGVNTEIVSDGVEGYWCSSEIEWFSRLEELILNKSKRIEMGKRGREKVIKHYSVRSNTANFLSLFQ